MEDKIFYISKENSVAVVERPQPVGKGIAPFSGC